MCLTFATSTENVSLTVTATWTSLRTCPTWSSIVASDEPSQIGADSSV